MKIVIFTATGAENLGDELITVCEVESFRKNIPDIEITLFSHNTERTRRFFLSQKISLEKIIFKEYFPNDLKKYPLKNIKLFWETLKIIINTDHVYIGGGGLLYGKNEEGHSPLKLWWMRAMMAKFFRKPLTYLSLGISASQEELELYAGGMFSGSTITVRDKKSQSILAELGYHGTILPDPVLTYTGLKKENPKTIGIALREKSLSDETILETIKKLISQGYEIVLLPHSLHPTDEASHDGYYLQNFLLPGVTTAQSIEQTLEMYQKCHIVISMRLHSMILSIDHHIPFIGISYGQKTDSLLGELSWKYSFNEKIGVKEILLAVEEIEKNYSTFSEKLKNFHIKNKNTYTHSFTALLGK